MSQEDDVYKRLVTVEPPPTDIFRVFRANHPETLAFKPPTKEDKPVPDFTPETSITLRSGEKVTQPVSVLPILTGAAAVSAATRQMNEVMDINEMLSAGNWAAAEDILGRKLTLKEKQQQQILDQVAQPEEKAARELKMEALKARLKSYHTKYRALLAKYKATQEKRIKDELLRVRKEAKKVYDEFMRMANIRDDEDDDDPGFAARHIPLPDDDDEEKEHANDASFDSYFSTDAYMDPLDYNDVMEALHDDSDSESIAPTRVDPDTQSIAETVVRRHRRHREDNVEEAKEDFDTAPRLGSVWSRDTPWVDPHVRFKEKYLARAKMLTENYPAQSKELKGWKSMNVANLSAAIATVENRLDHLEAEERGKRAAKADAKKKTAAELIAEAQQIIDEPTPVPLPMEGHGLFTGLRRPKNPQDFVAFGPRMVIDAKKLKQTGQFSLIYPQSGQKNSVIRNATLSPALKEVILSYLAKEPMDTMNLTKEENDWLQFIWKHTGLAKKQPQMRVLRKSKPDTMARLKVLLGEYAAGNDNDEIAAEVEKLVRFAEGKSWLKAGDIIKIRQMMSS